MKKSKNKLPELSQNDIDNMPADIMETEVEFKNRVALGLHKFKNTPVVPSKKGLKKLSRKQKEELSKIKDPQELINQLDKTP